QREILPAATRSLRETRKKAASEVHLVSSTWAESMRRRQMVMSANKPSNAELVQAGLNDGHALEVGAGWDLPREYEPAIRRLNRLASVGLLSASLAHEIKNALVAGRTFIELLLEREPRSELGV